MIKIYKHERYRPDIISEVISAETSLSDLVIAYESSAILELFSQQFDALEIDDLMLRELRPQLAYLGWTLSVSGAFDCLIRQGTEYAPLQINSETLRHYLERSHKPLDIKNCAVLIGDYSFIASFSVMLAKLGYSQIYVVSHENMLFGDEIELLKKSLFGVKLVQLSFDELATIQDLASILVVDFNLEENSEIVEILTYFNFLTEGAFFCDLNSYIDDSLSLEAEKVQLCVVDMAEYLKIKYNIIKKKLNNRS